MNIALLETRRQVFTRRGPNESSYNSLPNSVHWSVVLPRTYIVIRPLQCGSSLLLQVSPGYLFFVDHSRFIQASLSKIQGLFKDFPTVFKDKKFRKYPDLSVTILLQNARLNEWRH